MKFMNSFLQSRGWEEFQKSLGRKTWRVNGALFILHELPFGFSYVYALRPEISNALFADTVNELKKFVSKQNPVFLRVEPGNELLRLSERFLTQSAPSLQPSETLITDISRSENEILAGMHHKTRYNIKLAQKYGVTVKIFRGHDGGKKMFAEFFNLLKITSKREKFFVHAESHYHKLLAAEFSDFKNFLAVATYRDIILSAAMVNLYKDRATYLHGASENIHRNVMAPYLMHWSIIREMKKQGAFEYDWWGIDENRWPGVTRFKLGFGGGQIAYSPAVDIVYRPVLYKCYRALRALKHIKLRVLKLF